MDVFHKQNNNNPYILVIKFEKLNLRKLLVSKVKRKRRKEKFPIFACGQQTPAISIFILALDDLKRENIGYENRLAFPKFKRFLGNICSFQQILQIKVFGCPWYESSKRYKNSSVRLASSRHVIHVISRARVFLSGNHLCHTRLCFLECRDSPRVFNFLFPFGTFAERNFLVSTLI